MTVTHPTKPALAASLDLLDRLVDVPPTKQECRQILTHFMPLVADASPAVEDTAYGQARRELSAALHHDLVDDFFLEAADLGQEITTRAAGFITVGQYSHLEDMNLAVSFAFVIDRLVDGVNR